VAACRQLTPLDKYFDSGIFLFWDVVTLRVRNVGFTQVSTGGQLMWQLRVRNVGFKSMIRRTVGYQKAALAGVPIRNLDDARLRAAWKDYKALGEEILAILEALWRRAGTAI